MTETGESRRKGKCDRTVLEAHGEHDFRSMCRSGPSEDTETGLTRKDEGIVGARDERLPKAH